MANDKNRNINFDALRRRAEQIIDGRGGASEDAGDLDLMRLIHELEVYQVELELQNEELRHTTEELERARNEYFELYDSAPVGFVTVNRKGIIERCNTTASRLLGLPAHRLAGRAFSGRIAHSDHRTYFSCLQNVDSLKRNSAACELRIIHSSGSLVHVHLRASVIKDASGRIDHWRLALADITEIKRAEDLRTSEKRFREAFEYAPIGMALTDASGGYVHVNDAFCTLLGYDREELVGTGLTYLDLTHPEDTEKTREALRRLREGEIPSFHLEKRFIRRDRAIIWARTSATLRKDEDDNPRIVKMIEDITLRKEAEEHLRQAQKMEAIGRLAGGVAHEFNNMLNVIHGNAELLGLRLEKNNPLRRYVSEITSAAQRSADMAGQLLSYSRKQMIAPQIIDLNQVIGAQKWMLQRLIGEAIAVRFEPGDDLWPVRIDPSQFDQVLTNLAVNARDAIADTGTVSIFTENIRLDRLTAPDDLPSGDYVRLTFSDSGAGMDETTRQRVFEPYFTTKEVGKGTGLGLASVYGIVKQHGGGIDIRSAPGQGTTFDIYFSKSAAMKNDENATSEHIPESNGETVLIVEDERQVLDLAKTILENAGYRVLAAASPDAAIAIARENECRIDLLVSDVILPEMNGRTLQSEIQRHCPQIPTLFMSGYTEDVVSEKEIQAEGTDFIQKPFTMESLTRKVRDVLDR